MVRMPGPGQYESYPMQDSPSGLQSTLLGWQRPEDEPESDVLCSMGRLGVLFTSAIRDIGVGVCASITEKFEGGSPVCSVLLSLFIPLPSVWQDNLGSSPLSHVGYGFSSEPP